MKKYYLLPFFLLFLTISFSQKKKKNSDDVLKASDLSGLKFRSVGPAFMSGRIADIAINPENENEWYVAVGSGGVWKTINSGTTWNPITDDQSFYSTGCITIDPNNSSKIWLGTGENVGGRHVGIGHGIYVSENGGKNWKSMGLKSSEHISKIIVSPNDSNVVFVASQGPLWSSGGERGLFKTNDGGKSWNNVLSVNEWTGVTDIAIDNENPNILYAATWQRHRMLHHIWVVVPEHQYISLLTMGIHGMKLKMVYQNQILEKLDWQYLLLIVQYFMLLLKLIEEMELFIKQMILEEVGKKCLTLFLGQLDLIIIKSL